MLECSFLYDALRERGVDWYAGVPDSLLKDFCGYVTDHTAKERHVITANEGSAIGLAAGYHLATGKVGVVYMQNSGLGNTVNPLTSLADPACYGMPMLMVVGWRGEPGVKDEPQHVKMGGVTREVLDAVGVPYAVLPADPAEVGAVLDRAVGAAKDRQAPFALLVRKGTFAKYSLRAVADAPYPMSREDAVGGFVDALPEDALVVSTTGKPSRELFELRVAKGDPSGGTDFLCVGSMGHASQIALGVALERPERSVWCLDGDGAVIMHLGGLTTIGALAPKNFKHVVLNNGAHDSVGGQPTVGFGIDIPAIAKACGYRVALGAETAEELSAQLGVLRASEGPALLEIRVKTGARADLGRPTRTPREGKEAFMTSAGAS